MGELVNGEMLREGIVKNVYPLSIDKPRGYQLKTPDNEAPYSDHAGACNNRK